jgi:hypothetical protein
MTVDAGGRGASRITEDFVWFFFRLQLATERVPETDSIF